MYIKYGTIKDNSFYEIVDCSRNIDLDLVKKEVNSFFYPYLS